MKGPDTVTDETAGHSGAEDGTPETTAPETVAKSSPLKSKKVQRVLMAVLAVAVVLFAVWFVNYWTVGRFQESTNDAYLQADAVIVAPKVSGYVEEVFVQDNQAVKKGDPLFRIDPRDYRSQVAEAQAQIDMANATVESLRGQIAEQQAVVDSAKAQLLSAKSDLDLAITIKKRYEALSKTGAESRETYAEKRSQLDRAQAAVASRQADLDGARLRVATLKAQISQAFAQAEGGEAQREAASTNLDSTIMLASTDGRIGNKTVQPGQFVQPGTRLMSIVPMKKMYIQANFKETQLGLMRAGQPVSIEVDALEGVELHGKVESFSPGTGAQFSLLPPENATGNFTKIVQRVPVRISLDAGPEARAVLVPGMSLTVTVDTRSAEGSLEKVESEQEARLQAAE